MIADDDEQAALASAEDDWNEDSRGESRMTDAMFRDAIFQLADLWTESIDVDEYVSFLYSMLKKIKAAGLGPHLLRASRPKRAAGPRKVGNRRGTNLPIKDFAVTFEARIECF
jgi:hypothetical protein